MPVRGYLSNNTNYETALGRSRTGTHLSTNIIIAVEGRSVGAIKRFNIEETRPVQGVNEVGTDGQIDSAPTKSAEFTVTCDRTRFDGRRIAEAFYRGFVHVHSQRVPFDIQVYDLVNGGTDQQLITVVKNCWITKIGYAYDAENFIISDNMSLHAEAIHSSLNSGTAVFDMDTVKDGGYSNGFEIEADIGKYRGALDAAGLINVFDDAGGNTL